MTGTRTLDELIRGYVRTRGEPAISVSAAARAVKTIIRDCPTSDRQLENMIAARALAEGYAVVFDGSDETASLSPASGSFNLV